MVRVKSMRSLIAASALLAVLLVFFLVIPALQMQSDGSARSPREQALFVSYIANALGQAAPYRLLVAQFYAEHGYFPSHIDEIEPRRHAQSIATPGPDKMRDIEIANFGDVVLRIRGADGIALGTLTLTAVDDEYARAIRWECHTADFKNIQVHFPQCRYEAADR